MNWKIVSFEVVLADLIEGRGVKIPESTRKGLRTWRSGIRIGNYSRLGENVTIGRRAQIGQFVKIGDHVEIGEGVVIERNVTISTGVVLEADVVVKARATIEKRAQIARGVIVPAKSKVAPGALIIDKHTAEVETGEAALAGPARAVHLDNTEADIPASEWTDAWARMKAESKDHTPTTHFDFSGLNLESLGRRQPSIQP